MGCARTARLSNLRALPSKLLDWLQRRPVIEPVRQRQTNRPQRWNSEPFLRRACAAIAEDVDCDSLDWGRLHCTCDSALTNDGNWIVVAIIESATYLTEVLSHAEEERSGAPLWLYVPAGTHIDFTDSHLVIHEIG